MMLTRGGSAGGQVALLATSRLIVNSSSALVFHMNLWNPNKTQQSGHGRECLPPEPTKPSFRSPGNGQGLRTMVTSLAPLGVPALRRQGLDE